MIMLFKKTLDKADQKVYIIYNSYITTRNYMN